MKRRKFLQILGLGTVAPVLVGTCSYKSKPPEVVLGIDFGNQDKTVYWGSTKPSWIEYEFPPGNEMVVKHIDLHDYAFPNKPIFPNYMTTNG